MFEKIELIWNQILSEAQTLVNQEPALIGLYYSHIINHKNFCSALSYILSNKLGNEIVSIASIREIIDDIYNSQHDIVVSAIQDIQKIYEKDLTVEYYSIAFLYIKGFHALQAYRISNYLWNNQRKELAIYLYNRISTIFSVDIHPSAKIGSGIVLDHATGIVIGATTVIQDNVYIFQSVTLGSSTREVSGVYQRCPIIQEGVVIGVGAVILGNVEIGSKVRIGAGSIVLTSIPSNSTVVGVPAKVTSFSNNR
ncbi:MAG: serine O-acetyltransferase [Buchnera aphidicola (Meitanaphis microgallis)]